MNSLENILEYINNKTETEIENIRKENILECKKILEDTKNFIIKEKEKTEKKITEKKEELKKNFETDMKQRRNKAIANKKNEILKKIIDISIDCFCNENDDIYINFIEKLIEKNIPNEEFTLVFGEKDYKKLSSVFNGAKPKIKKIENSNEFKYGFKIFCKKYVLNFDIENMFKENIEILKSKASSALCLGDMLSWKKIIE